jgi:chaperonin cofactor prefoldin
MMNELKELLNKGGAKVFTRYAVEIGDALWTALYSHIETNYSNYSIESVCQDEESQQIFAVLTSEDKYYRLSLSAESEEYTFAAELEELTDYTPGEEPQFAIADIEEYAKKTKEPEADPEPKSDDDDTEKCPKCGKPVDECECDHEDDDDEDKKKKSYVLEEIPEYVELQARYAQLESELTEVRRQKSDLEEQIAPLAQFKKEIEKKEKEAMIDSFYMLSDEDKADVLQNIDTYSLDDIEAKLSIICVRNRVSFNSDDNSTKTPTTYTLDGGAGEDASTPAWVKAAMKVAKSIN